MKPDLSKKPHVVATVTQPADLLYFFNGGTSKADVLEFRLDTLHAEIHDAFVTVVDSEYPVLATARRAAEGGSLKLGDKARIDLYERFLPEVDIVDTEISSLRSDSYAAFPDLVSSHEAQLLASFHDFEGFPGIDAIRDKVVEAYDLGAQVAKVAVVLENMADLFALVELVEHHSGEGRLISAMGMGPLGKLSRLVLARAGSCLNYGYLQSPNAPGQWPADDLADLIQEV
ncbi:MAG: type I 3-dehydroquinate dehydratase [Verrucomicrobiota bacterium]